MAAITTPYSLEKTRAETKNQATAGTTVTIVAGKIKIFLGSAVTLAQQQSIRGSLLSVMRKLDNDRASSLGNVDLYAYGNFLDASSGDITIAVDASGVATTDVVVAISATFGGGNHFANVSFRNLLSRLTENLKQN